MNGGVNAGSAPEACCCATAGLPPGGLGASPAERGERRTCGTGLHAAVGAAGDDRGGGGGGFVGGGRGGRGGGGDARAGGLPEPPRRPAGAAKRAQPPLPCAPPSAPRVSHVGAIAEGMVLRQAGSGAEEVDAGDMSVLVIELGAVSSSTSCVQLRQAGRGYRRAAILMPPSRSPPARVLGGHMNSQSS